MLDQDEVKLTATPPSRKMPLDVQIVAWLVVISALMHFLVLALIFLRISRFAKQEVSTAV